MLISVMNHIQQSGDASKVTVLLLPDLSAALCAKLGEIIMT